MEQDQTITAPNDTKIESMKQLYKRRYSLIRDCNDDKIEQLCIWIAQQHQDEEFLSQYQSNYGLIASQKALKLAVELDLDILAIDIQNSIKKTKDSQVHPLNMLLMGSKQVDETSLSKSPQSVDQVIQDGTYSELKAIVAQGKSFNRKQISKLIDLNQLDIVYQFLKYEALNSFQSVNYLNKANLIRLIKRFQNKYQYLNVFKILTFWKYQKADSDILDYLWNAINEIFTSDYQQDSILLDIANPFGYGVLAIELIQRVKNCEMQYTQKFELLQEGILKFLDTLQSAYHDAYQIELLYSEKFQRKTLLEIMIENISMYRGILNQQIALKASQDIFFKGGAIGTQMHKISPLLDVRETYKDGLWSFNYKNQLQFVDFFSFSAWKTNYFPKLFIELIFYLTITIMTILIVQEWYSLRRQFKSGGLTDDEQQQLFQDIQDVGNDYGNVQYAMATIIGSFIAKLNICWIEWKPPTITFDLILDMGFMISLPYPTYVIAFNDTSQEAFNNGEIFVGVLLSLLILRVFQCFIAYQQIGTQAYMILLIIKAIIPFILILAFSIFAASVIFWVIYYDEVDAFKTLAMSFRTIFEFSIGGVNFDVFPDETGLGMWLTIFWVFLTTISLLNIMIALLSSEFEEVISTTNAYYVSFIHKIWVYNRYISGYGGIVTLPTPLNCLLIIFGPLYRMGNQCKNTLDKSLLFIGYLPMFMIAQLLFFILSMILLLPVWLYGFYYQFVWRKDPASKNVLNSLAWMFLGLPKLMLTIFVSQWMLKDYLLQKREQRIVVTDELYNYVIMQTQTILEKSKSEVLEKEEVETLFKQDFKYLDQQQDSNNSVVDQMKLLLIDNLVKIDLKNLRNQLFFKSTVQNFTCSLTGKTYPRSMLNAFLYHEENKELLYTISIAAVQHALSSIE